MPPLLPSFSPNYIMYCIGLASHIEPMFLHESNGDDLSITAIIPAYNEAEHIERTIKSVLKQSKTITKILVIDDASTDRTLEVVKKFSFIHVLENRERIGKAASLNRALPFVNTDLVLIVDADTELEESFVEKACNVLYEKETIALCGTVLPSENSTNRYIQHGRLVEYIYSQTTLKKGQEMINGLFVLAGCCLVIDTSIIKEIGIPEDTITEDLDLTWLLELNGHKVSTIDEHAFTIEPNSLFSYVSQIKRWYMGFFQCLSKYGTRIFDNNSLSFTVLLLLLESLFFTIIFVSIVTSIFISPITTYEFPFLKFLFVNMILVDLFTICFPGIFKVFSMGLLREFIVGIPVFYILRIVNALVWWMTLVEWLFSYSHKWEKTH